MPGEFDQDARDRVVRLVEDRILAEGVSISTECQIVAPKWESRGILPGNGYSKHAKPARSGELRKTWLLRTLGYAGRTKNYAIRTSY